MYLCFNVFGYKISYVLLSHLIVEIDKKYTIWYKTFEDKTFAVRSPPRECSQKNIHVCIKTMSTNAKVV